MSNEDIYERLQVTVSGQVSPSTREKLIAIAHRDKIPLGKLIAIAIEHEFQKENPFHYDIELPDDEYEPLSFITEAGKILTFMKRCYGMSLLNMCLLREEMGIPNKENFLLGFRECLIMKQLEPYTPKPSKMALVKYDKDFCFYRIAGSGTQQEKVKRRAATEYETFQKLQKKFKDT